MTKNSRNIAILSLKCVMILSGHVLNHSTVNNTSDILQNYYLYIIKKKYFTEKVHSDL